MIKGESEEEKEEVETTNPDEDIRKRITEVADIVQKFRCLYEETRQTVKEQLMMIVDLGIKKYGMKPTDLRDTIDDVFAERNVSLRYLRKLLPGLLKNVSKTPLSYKHKQELKQQREQQQALQLQEQDYSPAEAANIDSEVTEAKTEAISLPGLQTSTIDENPVIQELDTGILQEELGKAYAEIKRLNKELQDITQPFITKTFLKKGGSLIPIIATIDPVKKIIISIKPKWY